jgi:hypothetical protein
MVRDAVRVDPNIHDQAVINPDRQPAPARDDGCSQVVFVGCREAVARAKLPVVEAGPGFDMGAFQGQHQASSLPCGGNVELALVPRSTSVIALGLQPERHFQVAWPAIRLILGRGEPRPIHDLAGPWGVHRDGVALSLRLHRAGESDGISTGERG